MTEKHIGCDVMARHIPKIENDIKVMLAREEVRLKQQRKAEAQDGGSSIATSPEPITSTETMVPITIAQGR